MLDFVCQRSFGFLVDSSFTDFLFSSCTIYCFYNSVCMCFNLTSDILRYTVFLMFQLDKIDV